MYPMNSEQHRKILWNSQKEWQSFLISLFSVSCTTISHWYISHGSHPRPKSSRNLSTLFERSTSELYINLIVKFPSKVNSNRTLLGIGFIILHSEKKEKKIQFYAKIPPLC